MTDARETDTTPILCEYAGIFCAVLGIPQLIAAGKARMCCRHYLDDEEEAS
jgi:hypothetical protein